MKLAVLIGSGSRLPAIYQYVEAADNPYQLAVVVSYKRFSPKISWIKKKGIPAFYHRWIDYKRKGKTREEYNEDLAKLLKNYQVDLVFGVGWDIIWTKNFLEAFPNRVLNAHPFPLPDGPDKIIEYKGLKIPVLRGRNALRRAHQMKLPITGACVHFARETVDVGPVLVRDILPIKKGETFRQLEKRHCLFEGQLLVRALKLLAENRESILDNS